MEKKEKLVSNLPPNTRIEFLNPIENELVIVVPNKTQNKVEAYCFMLTNEKHTKIEKFYKNGTWLFTFDQNLSKYC